MKKLLVLGYFGYQTNQLDGQTVKTRDVYRLAKEQLEEYTVDFFDTQDFQKSKTHVLKMFGKVVRCNVLLYLPAQNNLKLLFPIIFVLSFLFRVKIHYFVVGGWLNEFLNTLPLHRFMLRCVSGIHVETKRLKNDLEESYGFKNVDIFPNFRFFKYSPRPLESVKLKIVFMARIMMQKGLDWIFDLAEYIDAKGMHEKYSITFYGQLAEEDKSYFEEHVKRYDFVEYHGGLQPVEIHETLSKYDVMILPTHFFTEGLPGSVVDAYISGIPVIVTEWKHSHEFVDDGRSGYIVPFEDGKQQMIDKVVMLEKDRSILANLKKNALAKREEFAPPQLDNVIGGGKTLNLCFISRVEKSKGLDTLQEVASLLIKLNLNDCVNIDFYGQKTDTYFDHYLRKIALYKYKGILQPEEVVPTLNRYDALIFPTHYEGEGCAGILVEALSASLPIIASDWKYNREFVEDCENGFVCSTFSPIAYVEAIKMLLNKTLRKRMAERSYEKSVDFSVDNAAFLIRKYIEER